MIDTLVVRPPPSLGCTIFPQSSSVKLGEKNKPTILGFRNVSKYKYLDKNECYAKEDGLPLNQMSKK